MVFERTITNGKLDTVTRCRGGPEHGTLVDNSRNRVRFRVREPLIASMRYCDSAPDVTDFKYVEYIRVSKESMVVEEAE